MKNKIVVEPLKNGGWVLVSGLDIYTNSEELLKVAKNPKTKKNVLDFLSTEWRQEIREAVAGNPNTPVEILFYLLNDRSVEVSQAVRRNQTIKNFWRKKRVKYAN